MGTADDADNGWRTQTSTVYIMYPTSRTVRPDCTLHVHSHHAPSTRHVLFQFPETVSRYSTMREYCSGDRDLPWISCMWSIIRRTTATQSSEE